MMRSIGDLCGHQPVSWVCGDLRESPRHRAMLLRGQRRVDGVEPPRHRADAVIRLPHGSRRHLAQLVDVRVAQIVDVRLRSRDHDLLLARVLAYPRDALPSLQRFRGRAARAK